MNIKSVGLIGIVIVLLLPYSIGAMKMRGDRLPLHKAVWDNDIFYAQELLTLKCTPNTSDANGNTPLHIAVQRGNIHMVILLIAWKADPNSKNIYGNTPLHCAADHDNSNIASYLLKIGAQANIPNNYGLFPADIAKKYTDSPLTETLKTAQRVEVIVSEDDKLAKIAPPSPESFRLYILIATGEEKKNFEKRIRSGLSRKPHGTLK